MKRIGRRLWFPVVLVTVTAALFVVLGPLAAAPAGPDLAAMAPAGALDGIYAAPDGASATEQEIAKQYETVRAYPDTVDAYVMLGNAYLQRVRETGDPADYGRAQAAFDAALAQDADNVGAMVGLGALRLARHEFASALEIGQRAVELSPATARAHGVVVDALTELGRYDEAVLAAQRMVDLRPDLASLSRVSYQRELRGDIPGAIEAMSRAFDASSGASVENREYLRVLIGDLYLLQGDDDTAERVYTASLETIPGFVWANAGLGRVAVARGDLPTAIEHYELASSALPVPELVVAMGETQAAAGLAEESSDSFELVRAMQALFEANGVNVELELALFEANHGDPARAVELARSAYEDQPNVKSADALAWALYRAGNLDDALVYSREAMRLGTASAQFNFHAGVIAQATGDLTSAEQYLATALAAPGTMSATDGEAAAAALAELQTR